MGKTYNDHNWSTYLITQLSLYYCHHKSYLGKIPEAIHATTHIHFYHFYACFSDEGCLIN